MIELVFPSDTNLQLALGQLEGRGIEVERGGDCLMIDRQHFVDRQVDVEAILYDFSGRIWAD